MRYSAKDVETARQDLLDSCMSHDRVDAARFRYKVVTGTITLEKLQRPDGQWVLTIDVGDGPDVSNWGFGSEGEVDYTLTYDGLCELGSVYVSVEGDPLYAHIWGTADQLKRTPTEGHTMHRHQQTHPEVFIDDVHPLPTDWTDISYKNDEVPCFMVGTEKEDGAVTVVYIADRRSESPAHMAFEYRMQVGVLEADGEWTEIGGASTVSEADKLAKGA